MEITVTDVLEVPPAPQNLRATSTASSVTLEWDAPDDASVTGYRVLRRRPLEGESTLLVYVEDTGNTDTTYVDTGVDPGTAYVYRVRAINAAGAGARSNSVRVETALASAPAPGGVSASLSNGEFTVGWTAESGVDLYEVQYRVRGPSSSWSVATTTTASSVTFSLGDDPECGTTYEFRVRSHGDGTTYASGWGEESEASPVTTEACNRPPEFSASTYRFIVAEDAATTTAVGMVSATDPDAGDTVTYGIVGGSGAEKFAMSTSTAAITVSGTLEQTASPYGLTVEASDGRGGTATATVTIVVGEASCSAGVAVPDPSDNAGLVSDCETLLELRDALAGTGTLNWGHGVAMTSWDGVTVGGGRVTQLSLRQRGLTGIIPPGLGDLTGLNALWLHENELTGEIPTELGGLSSLIWMALYGNDLTGPIPGELGDLADLSQLLLQQNRLSGEIPAALGGLTSMIVLQLHDNDLSGPIPWELGNLSGLSIIQLSDNPLEGCVPPALRGVSSNDFGSLGLPYCAQAGPVPVPGGVGASVSGGTFTVTWSAVMGAGRYEVQYRTGGDWSSVGTTTAAMLTYVPDWGLGVRVRVGDDRGVQRRS